MKNNNFNKNWGERFDEFAKDCLTYIGGDMDEYNYYLSEIDEYEKLKSHIADRQNVLLEELEKRVEEMKKISEYQEGWKYEQDKGFNQALTKVLEILKEYKIK